MPEKKQGTVDPSRKDTSIRREEGDAFKEDRERSLGREREREDLGRSEPREKDRGERERTTYNP
jgi:hypothetical protein